MAVGAFLAVGGVVGVVGVKFGRIVGVGCGLVAAAAAGVDFVVHGGCEDGVRFVLGVV